MTLRTSCCNGTLLGKTLRRFWPLWLGYLFVWLLNYPLALHAAVSNASASMLRIEAQDTVYSLLSYSAPFLTFLMAPVSAMAVFSYLYNDKRAGVFAALPIRRESAFGSLTLAGLLPMLVAPTFALLLCAAVESGYGFVDWISILTAIGVSALYTLCFYGFAVFCAQLTGHLLIAPAVYAVLSFTAPVVELLTTALLAAFLYGFSGGVSSFGVYLSPLVAILRWTGTDPILDKEEIIAHTYHGWGVNAIYAAVGVAFLVLALLLYRKRRMETAGDVVAVKPLRKVFSFALGGGCALVLAALLYVIFFEIGAAKGSPFMLLAIGLALGGAIGWFGAEMLTHKTFRVFGKSWKGFAILFAVLALFLLEMRFDWLGFERSLPKPEDVQSVQVYASAYDANFREPENVEAVLALNEDVLDKRAPAETAMYLRVSYTLKNGRIIDRYYNEVPSPYEGAPEGIEMAEKLNALFDSGEAIAQRFPTDVAPQDFHYTTVDYTVGDTYRSLELSPEEAYEWYTTCVLPDVADGTLGRAEFPNGHGGDVTCYLDIYTDTGVNGVAMEYRHAWIEPTRESARTNAWLHEHGLPEGLPN